MNGSMNTFGEWSRRTHLTLLCGIAAPIIIALSWLAFPLLEQRNLGYSVWHFTCLVAHALLTVGIAGWIAQKCHPKHSSSWPALISLICLMMGTFACTVMGDFYWAFERGYFLD